MHRIYCSPACIGQVRNTGERIHGSRAYTSQQFIKVKFTAADVHSVALKADAFNFEKRPLVQSGLSGEQNPAASAEDPMPGHCL